MEIAGGNAKMEFISWLKSITRKTLLILDRVDGNSWVQDSALKIFQRDFLSVLQAYTKMTILITSQQEIQSSQKFRSYHLSALNSENCAILFNSSLRDIQVPSSNVKVVCDLVGGVPVTIKVLVVILSPPVSYPIDHVIQRLNDSSQLLFIADKGQLMNEINVLAALQLAFEFIRKEYQICALLIVKFIGPVTVDAVEQIVTPELMKDYSNTFYIEDCLYELNTKSFLKVDFVQENMMEVTAMEDGIHHIPSNSEIKQYRFPLLVKHFLEIITVQHNLALDIFWMNYWNWLSSEHGAKWLMTSFVQVSWTNLVEEVIKIGRWNNIAVKVWLNFHVVHVSRSLHGWAGRPNGELYQITFDLALSDIICNQSLITESIIHSYTDYFQNFFLDFPDKQNCAKSIKLCQQSQFVNKTLEHAVVVRPYICNKVFYSKCSTSKVTAGASQSIWKDRLRCMGRMFAKVKKACKYYCKLHLDSERSEYCGSRIASDYVIAGLELYALQDYHNALHILERALLVDIQVNSSCHTLQNIVSYMALYDIHTELQNKHKVNDYIAGIQEIEFQDHISCYSTVYEDIVEPFMKEVLKSESADEIEYCQDENHFKADRRFCSSKNCQDNFSTENLDYVLWNNVEKWVRSKSLFCTVIKDLIAI